MDPVFSYGVSYIYSSCSRNENKTFALVHKKIKDDGKLSQILSEKSARLLMVLTRMLKTSSHAYKW